MTHLKKSRMFLIFLITAITAVFAIILGYLQCKEKIQDTEESLKREIKLREANERIIELQNQTIDELKGSNEVPELFPIISYPAIGQDDVVILQLINNDSLPVNNAKIIVDCQPFDPVTTMYPKSEAMSHFYDDKIQLEREPIFVEKIGSGQKVVAYTYKVKKEEKALNFYIYVYNKGNIQRYQVIYKKNEGNGSKLEISKIMRTV